MKSSNMLLMAMLMVFGASNNLWAVATITNVGNEIVGVQFYDKNKKPLDLVMANNPGEKIPGELWYGSTTMNIPTQATFVTIGYTQGIPNTNKYNIIKELVSLFPIKSSTSYNIVGCDQSAGGPTLFPWAIVDSSSYEGSDTQRQLNAALEKAQSYQAKFQPQKSDGNEKKPMK